MTYKVKDRFNHETETEVVVDTASKVRPDMFISVQDWVDRLVDFGDVEFEDSDEVENVLDTGFNDKLDLAQKGFEAMQEAEEHNHTSSSLAEPNTDAVSENADATASAGSSLGATDTTSMSGTNNETKSEQTGQNSMN